MATKIDPETGDGTKDVTVVEPCTCGAHHWWDCRCHIVAKYGVEVRDTVPNPHQLAWIKAQHPGKTLIY